MSRSVCLSVYLSAHISQKQHARTLHVNNSRGELGRFTQCTTLRLNEIRSDEMR